MKIGERDKERGMEGEICDIENREREKERQTEREREREKEGQTERKKG